MIPKREFQEGFEETFMTGPGVDEIRLGFPVIQNQLHVELLRGAASPIKKDGRPNDPYEYQGPLE